MFKKIILVLLMFAFLFSSNLAQAGLTINEIMYDPPGNEESGKRDWIEIKNVGSSPIDLTEKIGAYTRWRFSKGSDNYQLFSFNGSKEILPGGYAVIASDPSYFKIDWPNFSGVIFDSSNFSLTGSSTVIGIKDTSNDSSFSPITYVSDTNANDNGNSLQLMNDGTWKGTTPTLGEANEITITSPSSSGDSSGSSGSGTGSSSTQSVTETKTKIVEIPKIKTKILAKNLAFVGIPVEFNASATGYSNELLNYGKYFWNFGDGDSKETKANDTAKFSHTFFYEGEYAVALEYFQNYYSENLDASDKIIIKVVLADISISNVGDEKDFFVEISNNTNYDADISKWILLSNTKNFTLPKNMILGPKKKVILSPKITGFSISDKDTLRLANSQWETIFNYSSPIITEPTKILVKNSAIISTATTKKPPFAELSSETAKFSKVTDEQTFVENLEASTIKSDINIENNWMYGIGLFAFLGISAGGAYFIRSRNRKIIPNKTGDDFEIIDE